MSPLNDVGMLLISSLGSMVLLVVVLRFLLQLVRADFYNPISQFIVKLTSPILVPLRRIIPGYAGFDLASLFLAYIIQVIIVALIFWVTSQPVMPWASFLLWAPIGLLSLILNIYFWGLIIIVVASWIAPNSYNPALILINQIMEPAIRPIRSIMPDLGGIDLSPIVMFLSIRMIEILIVTPVASSLGVPRGIFFGL